MAENPSDQHERAEAGRLAALESCNVLDTPPEEDLDRLVRLAARIFRAPVALLSLIDRERAFLKARIGVERPQWPRAHTFCTHLIGQAGALVVPDAALDPRFRDSPLVAGEGGFRFYAGTPLVTHDGHRIGAFCVLDHAPRAPLPADDLGALADLAALALDRLELRRLEAAGRGGEALFRRMAAGSADGIVCCGADGTVTFWNDAAARLFGYTAGEMMGRGLALVVPTVLRYRRLAGLAREATRDGAGAGRPLGLTGRRKDGTGFPLEILLSVWQEGGEPAFGVIVRELAARQRSEARLLRLARLDPLTELAERDTLRGELERLTRARTPFALMLIDLDGLKEINDAFGRDTGDAVLRHTARRLRLLFPEPHLLARLGGDEFAVVLEGESSAAPVAAVCRQALDCLAEPLESDGRRIDVGASAGIAFHPVHGGGATLLEHADLALYEARKYGRDTCRFFVPGLRDAVLQRRKLESELRQAHANGEFVLFFQPLFDLDTGHVVGAEALLRWNHPVRGLLAPDDFICVLEASATVGEVGDWVLRAACRQAAAWRGSGLPEFRVAVNLFGAQFHCGQLVERVAGALADAGLPPEALELEITETTVLHLDSRLMATLRRLYEAGVGIAFDDYGTGYASLSLLKRLPITRLKIDRSFVANVPDDTEDAAVVQAILSLGRRFDLAVTAEGVETEAQAGFLRAHGCEVAQGYLYGRPLPAEDFFAAHVAGGPAGEEAQTN